MKHQRRARVHKAVAAALYDQHVCRSAARFAAASRLVFEGNLIRKRQTVTLANGSDGLGEELTATKCASFGSPAEVIDYVGQAVDGDTEQRRLVRENEGHQQAGAG